MSVKRMSNSTKRALDAIIKEAQGLLRVVEQSVVGDDLTAQEICTLVAVGSSRIESAARGVLQSHHEERESALVSKREVARVERQRHLAGVPADKE